MENTYQEVPYQMSNSKAPLPDNKIWYYFKMQYDKKSNYMFIKIQF